jgi:hypothetical protein
MVKCPRNIPWSVNGGRNWGITLFTSVAPTVKFATMLIRTFLALALLTSVLTFGQNPSLSAEVKSARRRIFIENETGNSSVLDSVHLVLASSRFSWTDDRTSADLIFRFDRKSSQSNRTVSGNVIKDCDPKHLYPRSDRPKGEEHLERLCRPWRLCSRGQNRTLIHRRSSSIAGSPAC